MAFNRRHSTIASPRLLLFVSLAWGVAPAVPLADVVSSAPPSASVLVRLSLTPTSPQYPGDSVTISASIEPVALGVAYQFLWDETIIQPWSASPSCHWVLPEAIGAHRLTVQVRMLDGAVQDATKTMYIYRRPIVPSDDDDPSAD